MLSGDSEIKSSETPIMKVAEHNKPSSVARQPSLFFSRESGRGFFGNSSEHNSFFDGNTHNGHPMQPSLEVGSADDQYEREADQMANEVIQRQSIGSQHGPSSVSGDEKKDIRRQAIDNTAPSGGESISSRIDGSKGAGSPLAESTSAEMGNAFGSDFSNVRIHDDNSAVQMNRDLHSNAFTHGSDIYFNSGKYDPESKSGQHLLAHELTHVKQQGEAPAQSVQRQAEAPAKAAPAVKPNQPIDITRGLDPGPAWEAWMAEQRGVLHVPAKIGNQYDGVIKLRKLASKSKEEGKEKYELSGNEQALELRGMTFLNPLRNANIVPVLVLSKFGEEQTTKGYLSVRIKNNVLGVKGLVEGFNSQMDAMGFLGLEKFKVPTEGVTNKFEEGKLTLEVKDLSTKVGGFLAAKGIVGVSGETFTFSLNSQVDIKGVAKGELNINRGADGLLNGDVTLDAAVANVQAKVLIQYKAGEVLVQGSGKIQSEKFSGEITILYTEAGKAKSMMMEALGVTAVEDEKSPVKKGKEDKADSTRAFVGWGEVQATITPWLVGTAKVGIDAEGHVTIVGEIVVPNEVQLMEERGKKITLVDFKLKAGYGVPLVGQIYIFGGILLFINAGFGPLVLKNVSFTGTYSTDPAILQKFSITGTLNINAFAILGLEASAGVGLTLLGHDIEAGLSVTAAAGLKAYAEATPTFLYEEKANEMGGKIGEAWLKGHFEAAAQLFLALKGSFFVELDSPWWSPAPDKKWEWPLGEVEYPIGDSMGVGGDVNWLVGSSELPELKFSPVSFDPEKFTADVMKDPPPGKGDGGEKNKGGKWDNQSAPPELTAGGGVAPGGPGLEGRKKEDFTKLPDEQRYMRGLGEIGDMADKSRVKALTRGVVDKKLAAIRQKYALDTVKIDHVTPESVTVYVKHAAQENRNHMIDVPVMSDAERSKLIAAATNQLSESINAKNEGGGAITHSNAESLAKSVASAHPVLDEIRVTDGGETWNFVLDMGDRHETIPGKPKAEKAAAAGEGKTGAEVAPAAGDLPPAKDMNTINAEFDDTMQQEHHIYYVAGDLMVASRSPIRVEIFFRQMRSEIKAGDPRAKDLAAAEEFYNNVLKPVEDILEKADPILKKSTEGKAELQREKRLKDIDEHNALVAKLQNHAKALGKILVRLVVESDSVEYPPAIMPVSADNAKANGFTAEFINKKVPIGTETTHHVGNLEGWAQLQGAKLTHGAAWVRMHLLPHRLGGNAVDSNLTPARGEHNVAGFYNNIEETAINAVRDENKTIWYTFRISYYQGESIAFPSSLRAAFGEYTKDGATFKKEKASKNYAIKPDPPEFETIIPNLNDKTLNNRAIIAASGVDPGFIDLMEKARDEAGRKKFGTSAVTFKQTMEKRYVDKASKPDIKYNYGVDVENFQNNLGLMMSAIIDGKVVLE